MVHGCLRFFGGLVHKVVTKVVFTRQSGSVHSDNFLYSINLFKIHRNEEKSSTSLYSALLQLSQLVATDGPRSDGSMLDLNMTSRAVD